MSNASSILRDLKADDLLNKFEISDNRESILPNAKLRFAGTAYLYSNDGAKKLGVGSVVETDQGALLLWLCAYPLHGQDVEIVFLDDQGFTENDVGVLIDHKGNKAEFVIGSIAIDGKAANLTLFGSPAFPSSLIIREPSKTNHR